MQRHIKRTIRSGITRTVELFGVEARRQRSLRWNALSVFRDIPTLIDVGVAYGTPDLHAALPTAELILIDPLEECRPYIERILSKRDGRWIQCALGPEPGVMEINVEPADIGKSSALERTALTKTGNKIVRRSVPVCPLDDVLRDQGISGPIAIKIDTEGYELECLRGADNALAQAELLVIECSVQRRFENSYDFEQLTELVAKKGLKLHSVLSADTDRQGIIRTLDLAFSRPR